MATIAAVRAQVAARLVALSVLTRESAEPVEFMRATSHSPVHLEFGVGATSEGFTGRNGQTRTEITVLVPYQLEGKSRIDGTTGYDAMLTLERAILAGLQASNWGALSPRLAALTPWQSRREPGADGWIWLVLTSTALHSTL